MTDKRISAVAPGSTEQKVTLSYGAAPQSLTFDSVAASHREIDYDEVASYYSGPMSKHPVISVKGHPQVIWVRPDMGIGMAAHGISFAIGSPSRQIPWRNTKRSLKSGYLPVVISMLEQPPIEIRQTAFASLLSLGTVKTGYEKQVAIIEMQISNHHSKCQSSESLWAFAPSNVSADGIPPFPYNTYDLFEVTGKLPRILDSPAKPRDNVFREGKIPLGIYRCDSSVKIRTYDSVLCFELELPPNSTEKIYFLFVSSARGLTLRELERLQNLDTDQALSKRISDLEAVLEKGTSIQVPDRAVEAIYKAQILHNQSQILQAANENYCVPVQGYQGVWPWEAMKLTTHWDAIGHHEDSRKCLEYFLHVQGKFPPHGNHKHSEGTFGGTIAFEKSGWEQDSESTLYGQLAKIHAKKKTEFPNWMNGTGAMLYAFATHYFYTRDRQWLKRVSPNLLRACKWIISERNATKKVEGGARVLHYGLLPIGRAYDTAEEAIKQLAIDRELEGGHADDRHAPLDTYYPCWTDSYSSQGLTYVAKALEDIGHVDAPWLLAEAEAYRGDIIEVMRRTRTHDPDRAPYPERLYRPCAWAEFATGALAYVDTGFMDPGDEAFEQLESYMKKKWNRGNLGLTGGMEKNGDPYGSRSYYVNFSEDIWHRAWLVRGEVEKAILAFYSMLAYGLDRDTLGSVERFHVSDPRYAPFFLDTSGSARICGLIRQALLLESSRILYLLPGVPRKWLTPGNRIELHRGVTTFAKVNLSVSAVSSDEIAVRLGFSRVRDNRVELVKLRVPHHLRQPIRAVEINGQPGAQTSPEKETIEFRPGEGTTEIIVRF